MNHTQNSTTQNPAPGSTLRRRSVLLASLPAALAFTTACSGAEGAESADGADGGQTAGGTLAIADNTATESIDPTTREGTWTAVQPILYQTLTRYPATAPDPEAIATTSDLEGNLATSWETTADGIVFTLDPVVSSAGNTLTAADVVWSLQRVLATEAPVATFLLRFAGVDLTNPAEAVDDTHVLLRLTGEGYGEYGAAIFQNTSLAVFDSVLAKENATDADPWAVEWLRTNPAPFGPYSSTAFVPGESITLTANGNWGQAPAFEQVVVRGISDSGQRLQLLQSGQVQMALTLTYNDYNAATAGADVTGLEIRTFRQDALYLNLTDPRLADPRVRQAISMAIDREALVQGAYGDVSGTAATSVFPAVYPVAAETVAEAMTYDPQAATALLAEAGAEGLELQVSLSPTISSISADAQSVATFLRDQLGEVGITVTIDSIATTAQFDAGFRSGDTVTFPAWLFTQSAIAPDGAYWLNLNYTTGSIGDYGEFSDPAVDALIASALGAAAGDERTGFEAQAALLLNEALPIVPLADVTNLAAVSSSLGDVLVRYGAVQFAG